MSDNMLTTVLNGLIQILGPVANLSRDRRELKDNALSAISNALNETYLYYGGLNKGNNRNLDIESNLVILWSNAAIPIRHFDRELSLICELKSEYWINPEMYSNEEISLYKLELSEVRKSYRELLR